MMDKKESTNFGKVWTIKGLCMLGEKLWTKLQSDRLSQFEQFHVVNILSSGIK